ncbi:MAG: STAS domain-containing protein [Pseudomonadota bacterium]|nr:STAS domain-containing protein [Pseudomonadota bacterium]
MNENYQFDMIAAEAPSAIVMEGNCDLRGSEALASALREHLARGSVMIDASALQSADIASLQLLLSARKAAAAAGTIFAITGWEASGLPVAIERAGLSQAFGALMPSVGA